MRIEYAAIAIMLLVLLVMTFCSPKVQAQTWNAQDVTGPKCVMASKHCWCKEMKSAEQIRAEPERYERVPDYFGPVEKPNVCIEYVDKQQRAVGDRPCVVRRVCYKGSS